MKPHQTLPRVVGWLACVANVFGVCSVLSVLAVGACQAAPSNADLYNIAALQPARVVDAGYFATHLHRLVAERPGGPTTSWPVTGIGALRLWDASTRWADLEPAPGAFRFERLDAYVAHAQAHQAAPLLVLGSPPRWAAARPDEAGPYGPGSASEPARLEEWDRYVSTLARRYKGRIAQYELWNEPYFSDLPADRGHAGAFYTGSVASLVELARRTRAVLDRKDPQALLLTPGFVGSVQRLDLFLGAGGARHVGAVAYHFYTDDERELLTLHRAVRAVMARHGLAKLPLHNTETGFVAAPPAASTAAALLARSLILGAFLGVERYYQYAWDNHRSGMLRPDSNVPTPNAGAFAAVQGWLVGTTLRGCRLEAGDAVRCEGARDGKQLLIGWSARALTDVKPAPAAALRLPAGARVLAVQSAVGGTRTIEGGGLSGVISGGVNVGIDPVAVWWQPAAATAGAGR